MVVFWDTAAFSLVDIGRRFGGISSLITLIHEAASFSKTLVKHGALSWKTDIFILMAVRT
jgi:hypothetical protein